jgi:hypothetical protein
MLASFREPLYAPVTLSLAIRVLQRLKGGA